MTNEIDRIMDLDPMDLSAQHIDTLIAWHRQSRARHESGQKPEKPEKQKLDLVALGLAPKVEPIKRRI